MLAEMLGDEMYREFVSEFEEINGVGGAALMIGDDRKKSLISDRVLSKRLKAGKRRGTMDELNDYDEVMSDDEDERNMNNHDVVDDDELDVLSDDEDESEEDEQFRKIRDNLAQNLTEREYKVAVDEKEKKANEIWSQSDDENDDDAAIDVWRISDDDDDDDDDEEEQDQNVKIAKTKKRKLENVNGQSSGSQKQVKRRRLNAQNVKIDANKLKEELTEIITKILKKFADGLDMITLWKKVNSALSFNQNAMKKAMGCVIKEICRRNTVKIEGKDVNKYYLKKKYK